MIARASVHGEEARFSFGVPPFSFTGFDFLCAIQDLLPCIALSFEAGECFASQHFGHFEMWLNVNAGKPYADGQ